MNSLDAIRVVLVAPTHPGNVGGVARAMKNMGLARLALVTPRGYPSEEAVARAADAADVLAQALVCDDLAQAIADCHFVVGSTARSRRIEWPTYEPRECAARLLAAAGRGPVALLFGPEKSGLSNEALDRCHAVGYIPSSPAYPSLNLVGAVQIFAYELYRASSGQATIANVPEEPPASADDMAHFYRHLEQVLIEIGFLDPDNPRRLMRRLHRLFNRTAPDRNELSILRGILAAVQQAREPDKNSKE